MRSCFTNVFKSEKDWNLLVEHLQYRNVQNVFMDRYKQTNYRLWGAWSDCVGDRNHGNHDSGQRWPVLPATAGQSSSYPRGGFR